MPPLNLFVNNQLNFQEPDTSRFPALNLARQAMKVGGLAPTILNAANEIAVSAFLKNKIKFTEIHQIVDRTLNSIANAPAESIETILQIDQEARIVAEQFVIGH